MSWWNPWKASARFLLRRRQVEQQMDEEVRSFAAHRADALERNGLERREAERRSRVEMRSFEQVKEEIRDVIPGARMADSWAKDLRFALRMMRKAPGFTATVVLTLALGLGGTTAIFSVVKAALLDPLPYADPARLVILWTEFRQSGVLRAPASGFELQEIRARSRSFEGIAGIWAGNGTFLGENEPEQVKIGNVTGDFFLVLGAKPLLGRILLPDDEGLGKPPVVLLSYGLWNRRFAADPAIVGRPVRMDGFNPVVVGVMPPEFRMMFPPDSQVPAEIQAWLPFRDNIYAAPRGDYYLRLVGRLKPAVTLSVVDAEVDAIASDLRRGFSEFANDELHLHTVPLHDDAVREVRPALLALLAGIAMVLLIACVNVAGLLLARSSLRRKEIALRAALGASRGRVFRQVLLESLALAAAGGATGVVVAWLALQRLTALAPPGVLLQGTLRLDWGMLGFAAVVTLSAGILFGIAPALQASRVNLLEALQEAGRAAATVMRGRARAVLVVAEVAMGFVLLVGAGLMARTFVEVLRVDPGFRTAGLLTFEMDLPLGRYPDDELRVRLVRDVEERLRALPGVELVGSISHLPLDDYANWYGPYFPEGASDEQKRGLMADHRTATPEYFQAIGAQFIAGRTFTALDEEARRPVVVIDQRVAREAWPDQDPIGQKLVCEHITQGNFAPGPAEVVGVIRHIQHHALTRQVRGQIYIPLSQSVRWHTSVVVRTAGDPLTLAPAVRGEIAKLDKDLAISKLRPMGFYLDRARAASRFTMLLAAVFGALALLLAALGIYGVVAYSANQRTREFGIRMALGARPRDVRGQVLREGITLALGGLLLGAAGAMLVGRFLQALLFGVTANDLPTYLACAVILPAIALLACWLPANRAARRDPLTVLRAE